MEKQITEVTAEVITDSRGLDTIEVTVYAGEFSGSFAVPGGASTGSNEVRVKEAQEAVSIIEQVVAPALLGKQVTDQAEIDSFLHALDDTKLFEKIGGNVALAVSIATCKTGAKVVGVPTWKYIQSLSNLSPQGTAPRLFVNLINGGKHAKYGSVIQEHQIIPETDDISLAYDTACMVQEKLSEILNLQYGEENVGKGDEGGFVIPTNSAIDSFLHIEEAIDSVDCPVPVSLGTDIAASSFFDKGMYDIEGKLQDTESLLEFYRTLQSRVPRLRFVEDPFEESDFDGYASYVQTFPEILVIGDDLTTTNKESLQKAIDTKALTGIIIKPNQIGTVSDTLATMSLAYTHNIKCIVSHRSGETMDDFIADLAFGTGSFGMKAGAPYAKERDVKYRRLITIQNS
jgi:enolase